MFSYGHPVDSKSFSEKTIPHCSATFVISKRAHMSEYIFYTLYSVPLYPLSLLAPVPHFLNYCNFIVSLEPSLVSQRVKNLPVRQETWI